MSPSPPRTLRRSPPRRALHERSDSHANEAAPPSLRMVDNADAQIYKSSPFPLHPSQVLSPRGGFRQGFGFDDGLGVSKEEYHPDDMTTTTDPTVQPRYHEETEQSGSSSDNGGLPTQNPTSNQTPPDVHSSSSPVPPDDDLMRYISERRGLARERMGPNDGIDDDGLRVSDEIVPLPSVKSFSVGRGGGVDSRPVTPRSHPGSSSDHVHSNHSNHSLSSAGSSGTVVRNRERTRGKRGSYTAFPPPPVPSLRPDSSRSGRSFSTPFGPSSQSSTGSSPSQGSSPFPTPDHRTASVPIYASLQPGKQSAPVVQFPVVRPSSQAFRAESSDLSSRPQHVEDRNVPDRWNPHLSKISSEGTGDRDSRGTMLASDSGPSKSSSMAVDLSSASSNPVPPQPSHVRERDITGSTVRVVNEDGDESKLSPSILQAPGAAFFHALSSDRPKSPGPKPPKERRVSATRAGPGSRGSMLKDSIPVWARSYYANQNHDATQSSDELDPSRPETRSSRISGILSGDIFRPKNPHPNRPVGIDTAQTNRKSQAIQPVTQHDNGILEIRGPPRRKISQVWSPHLWHDRQSMVHRRSVFHAPSVDEQAEGKSMNKRNIQIALFVLGFLFPPAWLLAAFLPLPARPVAPSTLGPSNNTNSPLHRFPKAVADLEKTLGYVDEKRYENARWWRNINRMMTVIGLLIIAIIIALAVVATHG